MEKGKQFKKLMENEEIVVAMGAATPLFAKLIDFPWSMLRVRDLPI